MGIISSGDRKEKKFIYSLTCYEGIDSERYRKGRINVGMGLKEAEIRYGKQEWNGRRRESSRNGKKKVLIAPRLGHCISFVCPSVTSDTIVTLTK